MTFATFGLIVGVYCLIAIIGNYLDFCAEQRRLDREHKQRWGEL